MWNSHLSFKQKHRVFQSIFLPLITYALPQAVLLESDLHRLDSWYMHKLRSLLGIKHSFYSRVSHRTAFERAGCPLLPSTFIIKQQMKFLQQILSSPAEDPTFHVCFAPGLNDRVALGRKRVGRPRTHYLQSLITRCAPICNLIGPPLRFPRPSPRDILYINRLDHKYWQAVIAAPTRMQSCFSPLLSES